MEATAGFLRLRECGRVARFFFYKTDAAMGPPATASGRSRSRASTSGKQAAAGGAAKSVDATTAATKHAALCRLANPKAKWRAAVQRGGGFMMTLCCQ